MWNQKELQDYYETEFAWLRFQVSQGLDIREANVRYRMLLESMQFYLNGEVDMELAA